jgi:hypothetical protein
MQIRFRYLVEDRDRHGNIRFYVRVPGRTKARIRAPFGTDEFVAAYNAAVSDHVRGPRQSREAKPGSFRHLCVLYYGSPVFKRFDKAFILVNPEDPPVRGPARAETRGSAPQRG